VDGVFLAKSNFLKMRINPAAKSEGPAGAAQSSA
jgi:hypothetical protein